MLKLAVPKWKRKRVNVLDEAEAAVNGIRIGSGWEGGEGLRCWRNLIERLVVTRLALHLYEKGERA